MPSDRAARLLRPTGLAAPSGVATAAWSRRRDSATRAGRRGVPFETPLSGLEPKWLEPKWRLLHNRGDTHHATQVIRTPRPPARPKVATNPHVRSPVAPWRPSQLKSTTSCVPPAGLAILMGPERLSQPKSSASGARNDFRHWRICHVGDPRRDTRNCMLLWKWPQFHV